jgi:hypothetical protein
MKKYTLNSEINSNLEKSFNDVENIIKSLANIDNPFSLNNELNLEYHKLIEMFNNSKKDRKKLLIRRKSINMKGINFSNFPLIGTDKASVINNENLSNI